MVNSVRRLLFGQPLPSSAVETERLTKPRAIGAFGLDALSSVAYGPDEILYVLLLAGSAGTALDLPVAMAIAALLAIVAFSYRQTIHAYPHGGGSYTVARENLGVTSGLVAAAALMVDYLTTVAVSVTAGIQALIAFIPQLDRYRVVAGVAAVALLVLVNLRGVREAGAAFIIPTYIFVGSLAAMLAIGTVRLATSGAPALLHSAPAPVTGLSIFLVLRAFAGGCTAMTGVEAIANGVPVFRKPEAQNAARTLVVLAIVLGVLFLGVAALGKAIGAVPSDQANVLSEIGQTFVPNSPLFYIVQVSAALVLLLAANTSFNGFPRLAAVMADDSWFPHQFTHRGMRLAYSNGIIVIGALAAALIIIFGGSTHALIPLFAVGVFLCFTLSQAGMVGHWLRTQERGWRWKMVVNGTGAVVTAMVTVVVLTTKFVGGAWIVLVLVPFLVLNFIAIHSHYSRAHRELQQSNIPHRARGPEHVLVPVKTMDRAAAAAIDYACSISTDVTAVYFATDAATADEFRARWREWASRVHIEALLSPYREVITPLTGLIDAYQASHHGKRVTVILPDIVTHHLWEEPLHNQTGLAIKLALLRKPNVIVTSVPIRLRG